jgi:hypothetical protein
MKLRGVLDFSLGNFLCLRGFAPMGVLYDLSDADPSFQRDLLNEHREEILSPTGRAANQGCAGLTKSSEPRTRLDLPRRDRCRLATLWTCLDDSATLAHKVVFPGPVLSRTTYEVVEQGRKKIGRKRQNVRHGNQTHEKRQFSPAGECHEREKPNEPENERHGIRQLGRRGHHPRELALVLPSIFPEKQAFATPYQEPQDSAARFIDTRSVNQRHPLYVA